MGDLKLGDPAYIEEKKIDLEIRLKIIEKKLKSEESLKIQKESKYKNVVEDLKKAEELFEKR